MAERSKGFSYVLSVNDIDTSLLPPDARQPGTDAFREAVTSLIANDFEGFGGHARIVVSAEVIEVDFTPDSDHPAPLEFAVGKLREGKIEEGIRLLETLYRLQPKDVTVMVGLGMAYSDAEKLHLAVPLLERACSLEPTHVDARVALGVAYTRQERWQDAIHIFRETQKLDSSNPWLLRNLGGCLLHEGRPEEAEIYLRHATDLNPNDQHSVYGLAQALHMLKREKEADKLYLRAIEMDGRSPVAEQARIQRTSLAGQSFSETVSGGVRMDAVMYLSSAIKKFRQMPPDEVHKIVFEIAILGQQGIDPTDSAQKYQLRSLPGQFSGLHLLCLMFAGFKIIAPDDSMGFDLSKEYAVAKAMSGPSKAG